jgi:hypothetical protein
MMRTRQRSAEDRRNDPHHCSRVGIPNGWQQARGYGGIGQAHELADTMLKDFEQHGIVLPDGRRTDRAALRDIPRRVRARAGPGRQAHTVDGDQHGPKNSPRPCLRSDTILAHPLRRMAIESAFRIEDRQMTDNMTPGGIVGGDNAASITTWRIEHAATTGSRACG